MHWKLPQQLWTGRLGFERIGQIGRGKLDSPAKALQLLLTGSLCPKGGPCPLPRNQIQTRLRDLTYTIVREAQRTVLQRLDAADARIQSILSVSTGVTWPCRSLSGSSGLKRNFSLCWPFFIALTFVWTILIGTHHWTQSKVVIVDVEALSKWTCDTEMAFKKQYIRKAGSQVRRNNALVLKRTQTVNYILYALSLEIVIFGLWGDESPRSSDVMRSILARISHQ